MILCIFLSFKAISVIQKTKEMRAILERGQKKGGRFTGFTPRFDHSLSSSFQGLFKSNRSDPYSLTIELL